MRKNLKSILLVMGLVGCTDYQNNFDCPPSPGMGCQSISEIHDQIIEQSKGEDQMIVPEQEEKCPDGKCLSKAGLALPAVSLYSQRIESDKDKVLRVPERIIRLWVNGKELDNGDYQGAHYVYIALKNESWRRIKLQEHANE